MNAKCGVEALQAPGTYGEFGYVFNSRRILPYGMDEILQPLRVLPEFLPVEVHLRGKDAVQSAKRGSRCAEVPQSKEDIHEGNANQNEQRPHKKRERGLVHGRRVSHASRDGGLALSMARQTKMSLKPQQRTHLLHLSMANEGAQ